MSYEMIAIFMFATMMVMLFTGQRVFGAIGGVAALAAMLLFPFVRVRKSDFAILRDCRARLGGSLVTVADNPVTIITNNRGSDERFEALDQGARGGGRFQLRFHLVQF